nr:MAG TPA: hypothetical protein [Caudoviricetes sp.]
MGVYGQNKPICRNSYDLGENKKPCYPHGRQG